MLPRLARVGGAHDRAVGPDGPPVVRVGEVDRVPGRERTLHEREPGVSTTAARVEHQPRVADGIRVIGVEQLDRPQRRRPDVVLGLVRPGDPAVRGAADLPVRPDGYRVAGVKHVDVEQVDRAGRTQPGHRSPSGARVGRLVDRPVGQGGVAHEVAYRAVRVERDRRQTRGGGRGALRPNRAAVDGLEYRARTADSPTGGLRDHVDAREPDRARGGRGPPGGAAIIGVPDRGSRGSGVPHGDPGARRRERDGSKVRGGPGSLARPRGSAVGRLLDRAGDAYRPADVRGHERDSGQIVLGGRVLHGPAHAAVACPEQRSVDTDGPTGGGAHPGHRTERVALRHLVLPEPAAVTARAGREIRRREGGKDERDHDRSLDEVDASPVCERTLPDRPVA
jgi:hypothetical protein